MGTGVSQLQSPSLHRVPSTSPTPPPLPPRRQLLLLRGDSRREVVSADASWRDSSSDVSMLTASSMHGSRNYSLSRAASASAVVTAASTPMSAAAAASASASALQPSRRHRRAPLPHPSHLAHGGNGSTHARVISLYSGNGNKGNSVSRRTWARGDGVTVDWSAALNKIQQRTRRTREIYGNNNNNKGNTTAMSVVDGSSAAGGVSTSTAEGDLHALTRNADAVSLRVLQQLQDVERLPRTTPTDVVVQQLRACYPLLAHVPSERVEQLTMMVCYKEAEAQHRAGATDAAKELYARVIRIAEQRVARQAADMYVVLKRYVLAMIGLARIWYTHERQFVGFTFVDRRHPRIRVLATAAAAAAAAAAGGSNNANKDDDCMSQLSLSSIASLESTLSSDAGSVFSLNHAILHAARPRPPRRRTGPQLARVKLVAPHTLRATLDREDEFVLHSNMTRELVASPCELLLLRCCEVVEIGLSCQSELLLPPLLELAQLYEDLQLHSRALLLVRRCIGTLCSVFDYDHPWVVQLHEHARRLTAALELQRRTAAATKIQAAWRMYRAMCALERRLGHRVHRHTSIHPDTRALLLQQQQQQKQQQKQQQQEEQAQRARHPTASSFSFSRTTRDSRQSSHTVTRDSDCASARASSDAAPRHQHSSPPQQQHVYADKSMRAAAAANNNNIGNEDSFLSHYLDERASVRSDAADAGVVHEVSAPTDHAAVADTDSNANGRDDAVAPTTAAAAVQTDATRTSQPPNGDDNDDDSGNNKDNEHKQPQHQQQSLPPPSAAATAVARYDALRGRSDAGALTMAVPRATVVGNTQDTMTDTFVQHTELGEVLTIRTTTVTKTITERLVHSDSDSDAGDGDGEEHSSSTSSSSSKNSSSNGADDAGHDVPVTHTTAANKAPTHNGVRLYRRQSAQVEVLPSLLSPHAQTQQQQQQQQRQDVWSPLSSSGLVRSPMSVTRTTAAPTTAAPATMTTTTPPAAQRGSLVTAAAPTSASRTMPTPLSTSSLLLPSLIVAEAAAAVAAAAATAANAQRPSRKSSASMNGTTTTTTTTHGAPSCTGASTSTLAPASRHGSNGNNSSNSGVMHVRR